MELQQLTDRAPQGLLLLLPVRLLPDVEAATAAEREVSLQRSPASLPSSPARAAEANAQAGSAFSYGEKWSKMRHIPDCSQQHFSSLPLLAVPW